MGFLNMLKEKRLWKNIGFQIVIFIFILIVLYFRLSHYTYHGKSTLVPDFSGKTLAQAMHEADLHELKAVLSDSVHFQDKPKGMIVSQYPEANAKVKPERTIYLVVNGYDNENIPMPDLRGISLRQAYSDAELFGIKVGRLTYVPDISTTVLEQQYKNKVIEPQTLIPKGSSIDLVIGKGESNEKTSVICIIGKSVQEAKSLLALSSLNIGVVVADKTVVTASDSAKAVIWKQSPTCNYNSGINLGSYIDVWVTLDKDLVPENTQNINL
jgi:beta-lactam-binding protein with PASTA domain